MFYYWFVERIMVIRGALFAHFVSVLYPSPSTSRSFFADFFQDFLEASLGENRLASPLQSLVSKDVLLLPFLTLLEALMMWCAHQVFKSVSLTEQSKNTKSRKHPSTASTTSPVLIIAPPFPWQLSSWVVMLVLFSIEVWSSFTRIASLVLLGSLRRILRRLRLSLRVTQIAFPSFAVYSGTKSPIFGTRLLMIAHAIAVFMQYSWNTTNPTSSRLRDHVDVVSS